MKNKNKKKGFTLVELLASLVILGLLTLIAAPNIMGILQSTKLNTYVKDAEKLVTLAQYKFKSDSSIVKPAAKSANPSAGSPKCIIMTMKYLGTGEFENPPYGGSYKYEFNDPANPANNKDVARNSFVVIKRVDSATNVINYEYYVQLVEFLEGKNKFSGIPLAPYSTVKTAAPIDFIETGLTSASQITSSDPTTISVGGENCVVQARYVG